MGFGLLIVNFYVNIPKC